MRFLADENFPLAAVEALRGAGHDVAWVRVDSPGLPDEEVLARGLREDRLLLTFDTDFGGLAFRRGASTTRGVILFRVPVVPPSFLAQIIVTAIESRPDWQGHFSVVELGRVRMRRLPTGQSRGRP
jgi:predicted nuclease of predicted toxin-antitoxin system